MDIPVAPPSLHGPNAEGLRVRLRAIAQFADVFATPGFIAGEWDSRAGEMPSFAPGVEVSAFADAAYKAGLVFSFDWTGWMDEAERLSTDDNALAAADLDELAKLVTTLVRQDRFVEGSLGRHVESGLVTAILRRLAVLVA